VAAILDKKNVVVTKYFVLQKHLFLALMIHAYLRPLTARRFQIIIPILMELVCGAIGLRTTTSIISKKQI